MAKIRLPETTITATLHDADGPWTRWMAWPGVSAALFVAGLFLSFWYESARWLEALGFLSCGVGFLSPLLLPRGEADRARILCKKGRVRIRGAGLLNRTISPKQVVGATSARLGDRFVLSLSLSGNPSRPLHLEVDSVEQLATICDALGVGHNGYGTVNFEQSVRTLDVVEPIARLLFGLAALAIAWPAATIARNFEWQAGDLTPWGVYPLVNAAALVATIFAARRSYRGTFSLRADSMFVGTRWGARGVDYSRTRAVQLKPANLVVDGDAPHVFDARPARWLRDGMSPREREILNAQIETAARRANGKSAWKDDATETLSPLRRGSMGVAQWLAHLDGIAASAGGGTGYRGGVTFGKEDLRRTFEDPDADPELRGAAGRVLLRIAPDETRVRVAPVLETIRDDHVREHIATLLDDDAERADRELEDQESKRLRRASGRL